MPTAQASSSPVRQYFEQSRAARTAAVAVLPLFVAYQVGILLTGGVRNGVDFITDLLNLAFHGNTAAYLIFNGVLLVGFIGAVVLLRQREELHPRVLPMMLLESAVYALLVGFVVNVLIDVTGLSGLLAAGGSHPGLVTKLVLSTGAGLYEELVFRLFLMGGLFAGLHRLGGLARLPSALVALVVSSLIFSAVHHLGNMGEPFTMSAFVFRFFAGVVFAAIFHFRGFAVAAWTHALYDVWVMVVLGK
jgi:membrane protease YdiL (CAAX protease family)